MMTCLLRQIFAALSIQISDHHQKFNNYCFAFYTSDNFICDILYAYREFHILISYITAYVPFLNL